MSCAARPPCPLAKSGSSLHSDVGREEYGHDPRHDEGEADDPEDVARVFAGRRAREADGEETRCRHQCAGQHREGRRVPGEGCSADAAPALFHLHDHHLDSDDRIVDQEAERDDERAERDAVEVQARDVHDEKDDREHERNRGRNYEARAPSERQEAHDEHDSQRLDERVQELADQFLDDARLVRDLVDVDADRNLRSGVRNRIFEPLSKFQDVGALGHGDNDADCVAAVVAHDAARWVLVAALDGGDVAEPEGRAP